MPIVAEEQVLVVPSSVLHDLGHFQGFSGEVDRYLPKLFECDELSYRPRGEMEDDPSFKQLIPYVVFRYTDAAGTANLFQYTRGGGVGEARLAAKKSVGVGGHISTLDLDTVGAGCNNRGDVYREGLRRELEEEVAINALYEGRIVGLINDDETPVGKVHLGVVHLFEMQEPEVTPREDDLCDASFQPIDEILDELDRYESWSQIAVEAVRGIR